MTAEDSANSLLGKTLGPCRIEAIIGRGGMGVVYRAFHLPLDRPVAVKVLRPELMARPGAGESLTLEARSAARIEDPHVVPIYDVGRQDGITYIIMQLMEGETLAAKIAREGPLKQDVALRLMSEVIAGLAAAHRLGVVHRDVKPSNIIIDSRGGVKLMDFGIAASFDSDPNIKTVCAGSPEYMAPEQAFGWEPDVRADLYSFGITYFYALTGRLPYTGANAAELMIQHRESPVPDARQFNRQVTEAAARLIESLMAKTPQERPADAEEVAKRMQAAGMLLDMDPSGSPFRLLPPPLEEKAGFLAPAPAPAEPAQSGPSPAPPPLLPIVDARPTALSRVIFITLYLLVFGRFWGALGHADWLGAAVVSGLGAGIFYRGNRAQLRRKAAGAIFSGAMLACLYRFGMTSETSWLAPGSTTLEFWVCLGLIVTLGLASIWLGFVAAEADRTLALSLLGLSAGGMMILALKLRLSPGAPWSQAPALLISELRALAAGDGLWRWSGLGVLYAGLRIFFPEARRAAVEDRVINWNTYRRKAS